MNFLHHQARTLSYSGAVRVLRMQLAFAMVSKRKPFAAIKKYGERVRSTIASLNVTRSEEETQSQTAENGSVFSFLSSVSFLLHRDKRKEIDNNLDCFALLAKMNNRRQIAFTMAEVLITIGILGLVADMTIPTLITKVNDKALQTAKTVANLKFEEALNQMRANDKLTGYDTAESFANEFTKYIKTAQRCTSTNLTQCFPMTIKTEKRDIKTEDLTTGADIAPTGKAPNYPSNNVGLTLPSGIMAILNYDKTCEWKNPLTGGGTNRKEAMTCISMVYDVNGRKKPNKVGEDIILLNADLSTCLKLGSICIDPNDTPYGPVDCSYANSSSKDYTDYCGSYPSGETNDMWAGAKKACGDKGMHLVGMSELSAIAKVIYNLSSQPAGSLSGLTANQSVATKFNINLSGSDYWSSVESTRGYIYGRHFAQSATYENDRYLKTNSYLARCVR